jgi:pimeloyl-ACP methyl ester carboxylesterase
MGIQLKKAELPNGETLSYRLRDGGEKTLLLIHGNMTSSKHWDLLIDALPSEYRIVAVDLRGFGGSTYHTPIQSIKDFSDDVKEFVDVIKLKDFAMMGWSTGGAVAMQFQADYPDCATELILLASASTRGYPFYGVNAEGHVDLARRLRTLEDIKQDPIRTIPIQSAYDTKNRELLKVIWNSVIYDVNQPAAEKYEEYVDDMMTQRNLAEVYHALNTFNISKHHNGVTEGNRLAETITIPTLVLSGERDQVVVRQMTEEILEDLPKEAVTAVELKGCGHSALVDDLDQLLDAVTAFLNRCAVKK